MPYVRVNDIQVYYELQGDGEPLVVILGLGTDVSEWDGIIRWLAEKYKVLAFDNRGAGRTDKPDIPYSIEMMADDTAGLVGAAGVEKGKDPRVYLGGGFPPLHACQHAAAGSKPPPLFAAGFVIQN